MLARVHQRHPVAGPSGGDSVDSRLTRRALIGSGLLLGTSLVAGCTSGPAPGPDPSPTPTPEADADVAVRESVAGDEAAIIALYDAVIAAYPNLAGDLTPLRDEHRAHAEAMGAALPAEPAPAAPATQPQALAALLDAEQQAVGQRTAACEASETADVARTIALIAASEAGHAEYLRSLT